MSFKPYKVIRAFLRVLAICVVWGSIMVCCSQAKEMNKKYELDKQNMEKDGF